MVLVIGSGATNIHIMVGVFGGSEVSKKNQEPVFPIMPPLQHWGLTKRELYAALVLQGLMSRDAFPGSVYSDGDCSALSNRAVVVADMLIKALEAEKE